MSSIKLYYQNGELLDFAKQLALELPNAEIIEQNQADIADVNYLYLDANAELTAYIDGFKPFNLHEFYIEFINKRRGILSKELLLGAISYNKLQGYETLTVLDMTGGLGRDSILFALAGFDVTVVEVNQFLVIVLRYLSQTFKSVLGEISVTYGNSEELISSTSQKFDFIYYDPMFEDGKHALAKKDMQIIDKLIELYPSKALTINNEEILKLALTKSHKFIVKRDNKQPTLISTMKPTYQKKGKTIRFDIYQGQQKLPSE